MLKKASTTRAMHVLLAWLVQRFRVSSSAARTDQRLAYKRQPHTSITATFSSIHTETYFQTEKSILLMNGATTIRRLFSHLELNVLILLVLPFFRHNTLTGPREKEIYQKVFLKNT